MEYSILPSVEYSMIPLFMTIWSTPYRHPVEYSMMLYI